MKARRIPKPAVLRGKPRATHVSRRQAAHDLAGPGAAPGIHKRLGQTKDERARILVSRAQLKKIASLREKKGAYHAVGGNYTEIGVWLGTLPGFVLALAAPKLWYAGLVLAVIGGILLGKAGKKKGAELDDIYREVALELKREAEAEAARQEASRALEGGAEEIPEATEITENKGETNNG